jgi:hypothetical protein
MPVTTVVTGTLARAFAETEIAEFKKCFLEPNDRHIVLNSDLPRVYKSAFDAPVEDAYLDIGDKLAQYLMWRKNVCAALVSISGTLYIAFNKTIDSTYVEPTYFSDFDDYPKLLERVKGLFDVTDFDTMSKVVGKLQEEVITGDSDIQISDPVLQTFATVCRNSVPSASTKFYELTVLIEMIEIKIIRGCRDSVAVLKDHLDHFNNVKDWAFLTAMARYVSDKRLGTPLLRRIQKIIGRKVSVIESYGPTGFGPAQEDLQDLMGFWNSHISVVYVDLDGPDCPHDLHCEIKLYLYLKSTMLDFVVEIPTLQFRVSKPCCIHCTSYFFCFIIPELRPEFMSVCAGCIGMPVMTSVHLAGCNIPAVHTGYETHLVLLKAELLRIIEDPGGN